jgi:hypothetical protein
MGHLSAIADATLIDVRHGVRHSERIMRRPTVKRPDDFDANPRRDIDREAIEAHVGVIRRHLIAAKAGRSGSHDTARRIEAIIRQGSR